ncbi:MAG: hypothetical protein NUV91_06525, partial [Candidatus Omnitrophica bacterium]|nr:hypothetical protein [Candidatus Omnitrophota bacterium]
MNVQRTLMIFLFLVFLADGRMAFCQTSETEEKFRRYCKKSYQEKNSCPEDECQLDGAMCLPRNCAEIPEDACPKDFCRVVVDCASKRFCSPLLEEKPPQCGGLSYREQGVDCCEGLVPRCGVEFLDATCDMEGKGTPYTLPICIACGDRVCGQFENRCNCPEDCGFPAKGKF